MPGAAAVEITGGPAAPAGAAVRARWRSRAEGPVPGPPRPGRPGGRTGDARAISLDAGTVIEVVATPGLRACLALPGGIDVPLVLGSRATDVAAGFGGLDGRPLRAGDRLAVDDRHSDDVARLVARWPTPLPDRLGPIHVVAGPHADALGPAACDALARTTWSVGTTSDRMGLRLDGDPLTATCRRTLGGAAVAGRHAGRHPGATRRAADRPPARRAAHRRLPGDRRRGRRRPSRPGPAPSGRPRPVHVGRPGCARPPSATPLPPGRRCAGPPARGRRLGRPVAQTPGAEPLAAAARRVIPSRSPGASRRREAAARLQPARSRKAPHTLRDDLRRPLPGGARPVARWPAADPARHRRRGDHGPAPVRGDGPARPHRGRLRGHHLHG